MEKTKIEIGQIVVVDNELLPLHKDSNFYVENGKVMPDETNWFTALSHNDKKYAIHVSEKDYLAVKATNETGDIVYCIRNEYPYIQAHTQNGIRYFINEQSAENANFKFSFRLGRFADANSNDFYGDEKLLTYHTQQNKIAKHKLKKYHSDSDEWLVGVEVEKEDFDRQQDGEAWKILHDTGWSRETDGSLGSGGYELVSPILPLFNQEVIDSAVEPVKSLINGKASDRCGGHINISCRNKSGLEVLEMFKQFAPVLYSLYPKRLTNNYCKAKKWDKYSQYPEKYQAFNIKSNLLEIRLFSRVINVNNFNWRLQLIRMFLQESNSGLNQLAQKIGCQESVWYKHFAKQYTHEKIGDKLRLMDAYSKQYGTHRNGISPSVKKRINNTMGFDVFPDSDLS